MDLANDENFSIYDAYFSPFPTKENQKSDPFSFSKFATHNAVIQTISSCIIDDPKVPVLGSNASKAAKFFKKLIQNSKVLFNVFKAKGKEVVNSSRKAAKRSKFQIFNV